MSDDRQADKPADPLLVQRLNYATMATLAHTQGMVPWRATSHPLPVEDREWCTAVCNAVLQKQARPPHPNPEIEKVLQDLSGA